MKFIVLGATGNAGKFALNVLKRQLASERILALGRRPISDSDV